MRTFLLFSLIAHFISISLLLVVLQIAYHHHISTMELTCLLNSFLLLAGGIVCCTVSGTDRYAGEYQCQRLPGFSSLELLASYLSVHHHHCLPQVLLLPCATVSSRLFWPFHLCFFPLLPALLYFFFILKFFTILHSLSTFSFLFLSFLFKLKWF